jgi:hypothetical protein
MSNVTFETLKLSHSKKCLFDTRQGLSSKKSIEENRVQGSCTAADAACVLSRDAYYCIYFGCCILDCLAIAGFLLKALSWVGVTAVTTFLDLFRWSGNVGAATAAPTRAWSIGSPRMSLGNIADESTGVCRGFYKTNEESISD